MDVPKPDDLRERLAERTHENWAAARRRQGWRHGAARNDELKEHPSLVAYDALSDDEKNVDREVSQGVIDALKELGLGVAPHGHETFREYEFIAHSTQFLTERRQAAAHTYLTVNTAIFAILGLLIEKVRLTGPGLAAASLPLVIVGGMSCFVWQRALQHYRSLIAWRYKQLIAIEESDGMIGSHRLYKREWDEYDSTVRKRGFPFSALEAVLPKLFLILYVAYVLGLAVVLSGWRF